MRSLSSATRWRRRARDRSPPERSACWPRRRAAPGCSRRAHRAGRDARRGEPRSRGSSRAPPRARGARRPAPPPLRAAAPVPRCAARTRLLHLALADAPGRRAPARDRVPSCGQASPCCSRAAARGRRSRLSSALRRAVSMVRSCVTRCTSASALADAWRKVDCVSRQTSRRARHASRIWRRAFDLALASPTTRASLGDQRLLALLRLRVRASRPP